MNPKFSILIVFAAVLNQFGCASSLRVKDEPANLRQESKLGELKSKLASDYGITIEILNIDDRKKKVIANLRPYITELNVCRKYEIVSLYEQSDDSFRKVDTYQHVWMANKNTDTCKKNENIDDIYLKYDVNDTELIELIRRMEEENKNDIVRNWMAGNVPGCKQIGLGLDGLVYIEYPAKRSGTDLIARFKNMCQNQDYWLVEVSYSLNEKNASIIDIKKLYIK